MEIISSTKILILHLSLGYLQVPQDAIFESETTFWPEDGLDSDCDPATTVSLVLHSFFNA